MNENDDVEWTNRFNELIWSVIRSSKARYTRSSRSVYGQYKVVCGEENERIIKSLL